MFSYFTGGSYIQPSAAADFCGYEGKYPQCNEVTLGLLQKCNFLKTLGDKEGSIAVGYLVGIWITFYGLI